MERSEKDLARKHEVNKETQPKRTPDLKKIGGAVVKIANKK